VSHPFGFSTPADGRSRQQHGGDSCHGEITNGCDGGKAPDDARADAVEDGFVFQFGYVNEQVKKRRERAEQCAPKNPARDTGFEFDGKRKRNAGLRHGSFRQIILRAVPEAGVPNFSAGRKIPSIRIGPPSAMTIPLFIRARWHVPQFRLSCRRELLGNDLLRSVPFPVKNF
jgi:hypothetical protein